jgi:hypothetical protein
LRDSLVNHGSPMERGLTTRSDSKVVFTSGDDSFTVRDLIDFAAFRGELEPIWQELLRLLAAEAKADESDLEMDDSAIDSAAEAFRYEHDLITAEETERWLEERGLTLNDFSDYFVRHYWGNTIDDAEPEQIGYASAPDELRELLIAELNLSGEMDRLAKRLCWRVAGNREAGNSGLDPQLIAAEEKRFLERNGFDEGQLAEWLKTNGRDQVWFAEVLAMEARYRQKCEALLNKQAREHEVAAMRLPLTRFELETMEVDSLDAAREALLCVRDDGMSMTEVAEEGRYPYRHTEILLEDLPEDLQQKFLSVSAGDILDPIARGDGFYICRVIEKAEPNTNDEAVRDRAEKRILDRHFSELTAKHIQWRMLSETAS